MPRVLVADDNPLSLRFLTDALGRLGIVSTAVGTGDAAIARANAEHFDLLLLDARMPGASGVDALAGIRTGCGQSRNATALATTAANDPQVQADLLHAGFADVLVKPITIDQLRKAVARHLAFPRVQTGTDDPSLDDTQALRATGGDAAIVLALRHLLANELAALPAELSVLAEHRDLAGLHERLHRLDASAGFCGAGALTRAIEALRATVTSQQTWPDQAVAGFLRSCEAIGLKLQH
ncbi:MAG: response regulator [Rhodanobacteraceae bacterium]